MESRCWSCTKAYAKKGSEGCEFHRTGKEIFNYAIRIPSSGYANYTRIIVTDCDHYVLSMRAIKDLQDHNNKVSKPLLKQLLNYSNEKKVIQNI